ncbi:Catalase isozyme 2 [Porphyridium purpureum]|uniref:Catalase n=1 Tax=Porphyridium purpureum TaxID=35688 RepID=A0A5J4YZA4_PORPP|nr:Catalase isozyme 2 [Porphyridium purpureum]|eukprot:POR3155..scf209_3
MDPTKYRPRETFDAAHWTTNAGAPVVNNMNSLTVGPRGPILLEDYHLLEKLANFDRERIPERVVHARGATAKGFFETTADISGLTCADLFRGVGVKTPVALRFSTVVHSRHSPETLRDPRGFAVKFYTREGNWDMVGNNMPVFFIRDGIKFPDMVHAFKPNPRTEDQEWWRILDFLSHHPESCHMLTFLLDDVGIPKNYRMMKGAGVHTFRFVNKAGKATYVKFHWLPKAGEHSLLDDEAAKVVGDDFSHATHDLIRSIEQGNFPEWTLCIQTMDPATENNYDFDPLDVTKTWPEDKFPLQPVGRLVLNRNVDNQFLENEQIAFSPALVVPGITYSDDKLLQTRLFSYVDTQRYRLGANYLQLPINAPKNAHHNNHFDGALNPMHREGEVNYFPSKFDKVREAPHHPAPRTMASGERVKCVIEKENNFQQPGERFRTWDAARQERFVGRVSDALNAPRVTNELKTIWLGYWTQCDANLGKALSQRVKMQSM